MLWGGFVVHLTLAMTFHEADNGDCAIPVVTT